MRSKWSYIPGLIGAIVAVHSGPIHADKPVTERPYVTVSDDREYLFVMAPMSITGDITERGSREGNPALAAKKIRRSPLRAGAFFRLRS
jgi:hypothetical protein